jgi:hypothetical protein
VDVFGALLSLGADLGGFPVRPFCDLAHEIVRPLDDRVRLATRLNAHLLRVAECERSRFLGLTP